jgi:Endonuclease-reverse transcriptase
MTTINKLAIWNANGLGQRSQEVKIFLLDNKIDIMLISETHFTEKSFLKIPNYKLYHTNHPDGKAHGGTAILIKSTIKHYEKENYDKNFLQATSLTIEDNIGPLTISAIYCPPKQAIKKHQYTAFFKTLGSRFLAGGDYNAKHPWWGSRSQIPSPKGRQLYQALKENNIQPLSSGEPTYWPTDRRKKPDLIDFGVIKGIPRNNIEAKSCYDLSSDHSPILIIMDGKYKEIEKPNYLHNKKTDWNKFKNILNEKITCNLRLKTSDELESAIIYLNKNIQNAAWAATPKLENQRTSNCSISIKNKILEKRRLRKTWQLTRSPKDKTKLNKSVKELKLLINKENNRKIQDYITNLTATEATNYSLWKATKKITKPQQFSSPLKLPNGNWARNEEQKAAAFGQHLCNTFKAIPKENIDSKE